MSAAPAALVRPPGRHAAGRSTARSATSAVRRVVLLAVLLGALLAGMLTLTGPTTPADARTATAAPLAAKRHPLLRLGSHGKAVRYVQLRLGVWRSGYYGYATKHAVQRYQRAHGLGHDGLVHRAVWRRLHVPYVSWATLSGQTTTSAARSGSTSTSTGWAKPIRSYRLSTRFGVSGALWVSGAHTGQDFSAPTGTAVYAAAGGTIVKAGYAGRYGNLVIVRHRGGTETYYAHLSAFVRRSGTVRAGELIARVGQTGNAFGSHLHFEVRPWGGGPVDPLAWLRQHGVRV